MRLDNKIIWVQLNGNNLGIRVVFRKRRNIWVELSCQEKKNIRKDY